MSDIVKTALGVVTLGVAMYYVFHDATGSANIIKTTGGASSQIIAALQGRNDTGTQ